MNTSIKGNHKRIKNHKAPMECVESVNITVMQDDPSCMTVYAEFEPSFKGKKLKLRYNMNPRKDGTWYTKKCVEVDSRLNIDSRIDLERRTDQTDIQYDCDLHIDGNYYTWMPLVKSRTAGPVTASGFNTWATESFRDFADAYWNTATNGLFSIE